MTLPAGPAGSPAERCARLLTAERDEEEILRDLAWEEPEDPRFENDIFEALAALGWAPPPGSTALGRLATLVYDCYYINLEQEHLARLPDHLSARGDFVTVLRQALSWPSRVLSDIVWRGLARVLQIWRFRGHDGPRPAEAELADLLADVLECRDEEMLRSLGSADLGESPLPRRARIQTHAALMLRQISVPPKTEARVLFALEGLPEGAFEELRGHFDLQGMRSGSEVVDGSSLDLSPRELESITDLDSLADAALRGTHALGLAAAHRLTSLGGPGRERLEELLLGNASALDVQTLRTLAEILYEGSSPGALAVAHHRLRSLPEERRKARFGVGLALLRAGWDAALETVLGALREATNAAEWFGRREWDELSRILGGDLELAFRLIEAPAHPIYGRCVETIVAMLELAEVLEDAGRQRALGALRSFLEAPGIRHWSERLITAKALAVHGDLSGYPVFISDLHDPSDDSEEDAQTAQLAAHGGEAHLEALVAAGLAHGHIPAAVLQALEWSAPDRREKPYLLILRECDKAMTRREALRCLGAIPARDARLRRLAEICVWGLEQGRALAGKTFSFTLLTGEDIGYTFARGNRIAVNPMPLLRGEADGPTIVRAVILHEIGHHRYHFGGSFEEIAKEAGRDRLFPLFNLVSDEHLERNLRSLSPEYGDGLKALAAWAFQHSTREVPADRLLALLGPSAFSVLTSQRLQVARSSGAVRLRPGAVLRQLEAAGSSFARFVRALRMGLGNRSGDPKVQEALALFDRDFRRASNRRLLGIARELRRIFGSETSILDDSLFYPSHEGVSASEIEAEAEGISDSDLERAIAEVLRERNRAARRGEPPRKDRGPDLPTLNRDASSRFETIRHVERLPYDPRAANALAASVRRWSQPLRETLLRLGLRALPDRRRLRGYRLDRPSVAKALVRHDPRLLVGRRREARADLFLGLLVDCSGSMGLDENIHRARLFAALVAEATRDLEGVDTRFFGFTDQKIYDAGTATRCAAHAFQAGGGNNDAGALWHAAVAARASRRRARLLVMVSDGLPTECSVEALRSLAQRLTRREQICCLQVAVRPLEERCFPRHVDLFEADLGRSVRRFGATVAQTLVPLLGGA